jgi:NADH:ubiquinone oxidoreductase subunit E
MMSKDREPVIEVCHGPECSDLGGRALSDELHALGIPTIAGDCRSQCPNAPLVLVDKRMVTNATVEKILAKSEVLQQ